ncbi:MAG: threonine--tRNA ligase, partial [Candidatus Thermoplasmatota archaeon]|nr:threonine--tRNA ligase [Candidatus Thermoplasmatota archaeon]
SSLALKDYLRMTEEAKKRDHRKLGTELDLFVMRPEYGPAFPLYTPKGTILRNELIGFMKELNKKYGWEEIWTPHAFKTTLWQKSGHMAHYQENMFLMEIEKEQYGMKPMNCPGHILLFQRKSWSYRDLPIRFSVLHRDEISW